MTPEQRLRAARAFWQDEEAADDQMQARCSLRSRRSSVRRPSSDSTSIAKPVISPASVRVPDSIAARALIVYHLAEQRPMMGAFLDALGIAHENGLIKGENVKPEASKIAPAASQLAEQFAAEDVRLYLNTLLCQDPETWAALAGSAVRGVRLDRGERRACRRLMRASRNQP